MTRLRIFNKKPPSQNRLRLIVSNNETNIFVVNKIYFKISIMVNERIVRKIPPNYLRNVISGTTRKKAPDKSSLKISLL
ncbi:MAG: hypothetical protein K6L81_10050 [Agarilytica sp.]